MADFARLEIGMKDRHDIRSATDAMRSLAKELDLVADNSPNDADAVILAHARIREASKKLRNGGRK